ncbi:hypothetical protein FACS1894153_1510 [Bacteroidia bacterium]|nr:hypothetical protein FACS1894153_1510 [Bacteroidia bacterium]
MAQNNKNDELFSINIGYGQNFYAIDVFSNASKKYAQSMQKGFVCDFSYINRLAYRLELGLENSTFISSGNHQYGKDIFITNFLSFHTGFVMINQENKRLSLSTGPGFMLLRDIGTIFGKPRDVKGFTVGWKFSLNGYYFFNKNIGISYGGSIILSSLENIRINYHNEIFKYQLNNPYTDDYSSIFGNLARLNLSIGICYKL